MTPIDHGDVCLDIDKGWFASHGDRAPSELADLTKPQYRKLLVVENPATSTPGLAFLLATVARFGEPGWQELLEAAARERRARRRRLDGGVHGALLRAPAGARASGRSSSRTRRARRPR